MTPETGPTYPLNSESFKSNDQACAEFLASRSHLIDIVYHSHKARTHLIDNFYKTVAFTPHFADATIVLGTSPSKYPDKFKKRVHWGCQTVARSRSPIVVFTGFQDDEAEDANQASSAASFAIGAFGIRPDQILTAGGNNTQQNFQEAAASLSFHPKPIHSVFVVSDSRHLLRSHHVAIEEFFRHGMQPHPYPYDLHIPLDPDNPANILELVKTIAYHRVHHNIPSYFSPADLAFIRKSIDTKVRTCYLDLTAKHGNLYTQEPSFETWLQEVKELE